ncbi:MAG: hypothetical protein GEU26_10185 [Nitrososphaeraceae archaeon]|nr:hypothetical protein [Nitrososphaeraceae archaeon]
MNKKLFAAGTAMLSTAVLLLLLVAPGLANASTTSEEFKTYTNEDYGFSIDYPPNWLAKEDHLQPNQTVIFYPNLEEYDELQSPATVSI